MNYAIIAAGEGSRLVQEGVKWPKPLVKLGGRALVDRLIGIFLDNDATSIRVIINEEMREVREHLEALTLPVPFHLLVRSTPSSFHSFYELCHQWAADELCLTTVDTIFRPDAFRAYVDAFRAAPAVDGLMAVTSYVDDEKPLYVKTGADLGIENFLDADDGTCRYISGGIYCLRRPALEALEEARREGLARMRNYQRYLVARGLRLQAYPFGKIIDVDHASDIAKAESFLQS